MIAVSVGTTHFSEAQVKAVGLVFSGSLLLLTACSTPSTIQGSDLSTGESFAGSYTPHDFSSMTTLYDNTPVVFASSSMTICQGKTRDDAGGAMTLDVNCADGRSGSITFTGKPEQMTGTGKLGKDPVTFTLDNDASHGIGKTMY